MKQLSRLINIVITFLMCAIMTGLLLALTAAPAFMCLYGTELTSVGEFTQNVNRAMLNPVFWVGVIATLPIWITNVSWVIAAACVLFLNAIGAMTIIPEGWQLATEK